MKALVQRVLKSELKIEGKEHSKIGKGLIVFLGVTHDDTELEAKVLAEKICKLRIFEDENDKMNLSIKDVDGELHIISQFTLKEVVRQTIFSIADNDNNKLMTGELLYMQTVIMEIDLVL